MKTPKIITGSLVNIEKLIDFLQVQILLARPVPRTMDYQLSTSETVYASFQASRQLTKGKIEVLYPLVLKMKMDITPASPPKGVSFYGYTVPLIWVTSDDKLVACRDDRHYYISARELYVVLNHREVQRMLFALKQREDQLFLSYTEDIKLFFDEYRLSV